MAAPAFRIYYADESIVDGYSQADWQAAPAQGVAVVLVPDAVYGRFVLHGADHYVWLPDGQSEDIYLTDDLGPLRARYPGLEADGWVKHGVLMPREQFRAVLGAACDDATYGATSPRRRASDREQRRLPGE